MTGFVYLMRRSDGAIKIGWSGNPAERATSLKSAGHGPMQILGTMEGGRISEKHAQDLVARHHIQGEWFSPHDDVIKIANLCDGRSARTILEGRMPSQVLKRDGKGGHKLLSASLIYHFRLQNYLSTYDFGLKIGAMAWTVERWEAGEIVGFRFSHRIEQITCGAITVESLRPQDLRAAA